eukprot:CAMPEP_0168315652 /NCGR_PEP_ID=MMETSP0210-20121227/12129_1 /TAXON_ID=40633 /ORGANISM="Condylostoma magnum, Strain COL2" /LENGTH=59 /DNA_ID=CAMNT_0008290371 /DNA_START=247 /DNA_END=426 /DNA_ORIENTATION=-
MEFCEGGDLQQFLERNGAVSEVVGKKWIKQIIEAFVELHDARVLHRDLKLANILLTGND